MVWEPAKRKAEKEKALLLEVMRSSTPNASADDVQPWDWRYWAEKVQFIVYCHDMHVLI